MTEKRENLTTSAGDDCGDRNRHHPNSSDMFSGEFPKGLRVLAFDEDLQHLLMLHKYLQEFQYEVTICCEEEWAMNLLRMNMYDIVILEAQSSDGDRLRMISEIGSDMDLPIIIISKDDSVKSVTNWMRNGACDYLIKPIRPDDLRFIFKHVVKKEIRSVTVAGETKKKAAAEKSSSVEDSTISNPNKRKSSMFLDGQADKEDQDHGRVSKTKKKRVVWDDNLNAKFMEALKSFPNESEAVPKKIWEKMNEPGITRANVASHLQKYRLGQKKKQTNDQRDERKQTNDQRDEMNRFPTHHINNIPQPSLVQQQNTNCNLMTELPLLGHHDDDGVPVSNINLLMNQQHQMSEFAWIDQNAKMRLFDNEEEAEIENLTRLLTQTQEEISLVSLLEPVIATTGANDSQFVHGTSMVHIPSVPSSFTHSSVHTMVNLTNPTIQIDD